MSCRQKAIFHISLKSSRNIAVVEGRVTGILGLTDAGSVQAAIAAGGRDNGRPGLRPEYHPSYYGPYVLDPDGNNIEAVCHKPGEEA